LGTAGAGALLLNISLGIAIAALIVIVTTSYRQIAQCYPRGRGSHDLVAGEE